LGRTDVNVSVISFGAWALGGDAWGKQNDEDSRKALKKAVDLGCNFIDTAAFMGWGIVKKLSVNLSEKRIRKFISQQRFHPKL